MHVARRAPPCEYVDRRGRECRTAWCIEHRVTIEDRVYCRRHAGVVSALPSLDSSLAVSLPDLDNRAPSLVGWVSRQIDGDVWRLLLKELSSGTRRSAGRRPGDADLRGHRPAARLGAVLAAGQPRRHRPSREHRGRGARRHHDYRQGRREHGGAARATVDPASCSRRDGRAGCKIARSAKSSTSACSIRSNVALGTSAISRTTWQRVA